MTIDTPMLDETKDNGGRGDVADENINTVHGRLMQDGYHATLGFELMCQKLEWVLAEDRWKSAGHEHINDFLATLQLPRDLRLSAERRKPIALQLKKLGASERAIGRTLGVDKNTVRTDLGRIPHKSKTQAAECNGYGNDSGEDSPLWTPSGSDTAKAVKRMAAKKAKRGRLIANGNGRWHAEGNGSPLPHELRVGNFPEVLADVPDNSVDLIFTDPPYSEIGLYGDLAEYAARKLKPGGSLLAYVGHGWLPKMFEVMCPHLEYKWLLTLVFPSGSYPRVHHLNVLNASRLVLWLVKPPFQKPERSIIDMVERGTAEKKWDEWQQHVYEAVYYIDKLSKPGDLVVEPFCGSGTTVLAARALGRRVIAAEIDPKVAGNAGARLDSEEEAARAAALVRELYGQPEVDIDAEDDAADA